MVLGLAPNPPPRRTGCRHPLPRRTQTEVRCSAGQEEGAGWAVPASSTLGTGPGGAGGQGWGGAAQAPHVLVLICLCCHFPMPKAHGPPCSGCCVQRRWTPECPTSSLTYSGLGLSPSSLIDPTRSTPIGSFHPTQAQWSDLVGTLPVLPAWRCVWPGGPPPHCYPPPSPHGSWMLSGLYPCPGLTSKPSLCVYPMGPHHCGRSCTGWAQPRAAVLPSRHSHRVQPWCH